MITHVHFDHIGNLKDFKDRCGCPVAIHANETTLLSDGKVVFPPGTNLFANVAASVGRGFAPLLKFTEVKPDIIIENNLSLEGVGASGNVIFTPGHTVGSLSVLLSNGTACVGDLAANHLPGSLGPILPPFADDVTTLFKSWDLVLNAGAKTICPGHGPPFPAKYLRKTMQQIRTRSGSGHQSNQSTTGKTPPL